MAHRATFLTPSREIVIQCERSEPHTDMKSVSTSLFHLPLMFYADRMLLISSSCFQILFDPLESLRGCQVRLDSDDKGESFVLHPGSLYTVGIREKYLNRLKVQHSQIWKSTRDLSVIPELHTDTDWTFTSTYWGRIEAFGRYSIESSSISIECKDDFFPMVKLRDTSRPIQMFKEILLWEDELDDNGHASFTVRFRLMEDFLFILSTYELRVDGVLDSRSLETRIYVDLTGSKNDPVTILREFKWIESDVCIPELWHQQTIRIS